MDHLLDNDAEVGSLGYGLLLGVVGALLTWLGISTFASIVGTAKNARLLLGEEGEWAQAKLLQKRVVGAPDAEQVKLQTGGVIHRPFFLVSYVFDAVRQTDGMTVRIEVCDRKVPSFAWAKMEESDSVTVRYLQTDPRRCRLGVALQHERRGLQAFRARSLAAFVLCVVGTAAAFVALLDHHAAGAIVWAAVVLLCIFWQCVGRTFLKVVLPCLGNRLRPSWSPMWMHRGFVLCRELGKGVAPSEEPASLLPKDVEVLANVVD